MIPELLIRRIIAVPFMAIMYAVAIPIAFIAFISDGSKAVKEVFRSIPEAFWPEEKP